ncbi:response regulator [Clavibacter michiganensis]|uniref:Transcriptional regulatory protein DegU n=1 Tax=Clavibacter michiganensis TaxID=28447 RepID=A0A251YJ04_9MICO|nr:response regulator transcription factor [Clavibacter michiganensis]OUE24216.1 Transcriptional regulatory protein DegU [Clavibacter michiganensis]
MRIVIAEDSVLLRAGLERLLTDAGHEIVAAVADASALLAAVDRERPDLAIVDVRMPPTFTDEGIRAAVLIRAQDRHAAVLVLSQYVEERYASDLIAANSAGLGYLLKDRVAEVDEFLAAVAEVGAGGTVFDPEVVAQIVVRSRRSDGVDALSPREAEVLQLMAEGRSNSAIAGALHVSEGSVEKHVSAIFTKLDLPVESTGNRRVLAVLRYLARAADPRG